MHYRNDANNDDRIAALRALDFCFNIAVLWLLYLTYDHNIFTNKVNILVLLFAMLTSQNII